MGKVICMKIGHFHMETRPWVRNASPVAGSIFIGSVYGEKEEEVNQNNQRDGKGQKKESGEWMQL